MALKSHLLMMASYHRWAYDRLIKTINEIAEIDYRRKCGLHFGSIHLTLNHLYLADCLWYARFSGASHNIKSLDEELVKDRNDLVLAIMQQGDHWLEFVTKLPIDMHETLSFVNLKGNKISMPYIPTLTHAFNHGTHHRGQISAVVTQLGFPAPEMDLYYYLLEKSTLHGLF